MLIKLAPEVSCSSVESGERGVLKTKSDLLLLLSTAAKSLLNKKSDGVKVSSCFPISLSLPPPEQKAATSLVPIPL